VFAIRTHDFQKNPLSSYRKRIKNILIKLHYFGRIKEIRHYSAVDTYMIKNRGINDEIMHYFVISI